MVMTYKIRQSEKWSAYSRVHRGELVAHVRFVSAGFFPRIFNRRKKRKDELFVKFHVNCPA